MKLGTRVTYTVTGSVERVGDGFVDVRDEETGLVSRISGEVTQLEPKNWPPQVGDLWTHLGVAFLVEGTKDNIWMISSDGGGSQSPEEVLRMRPGIHLVERAPKNIYSERGYENFEEV
jgi:hypothetical protein